VERGRRSECVRTWRGVAVVIGMRGSVLTGLLSDEPCTYVRYNELVPLQVIVSREWALGEMLVWRPAEGVSTLPMT
jgi:hypothetical protein